MNDYNWRAWSTLMHKQPEFINDYWPNEFGFSQCPQDAQAGKPKAQTLIAKYVAIRLNS